MKKCVILLLSVVLLLSGCGISKNTAYSIPKSGYLEITYLDRLSFYVPQYIIKQATAVTQIEDGMEYNSNEIYSFNNGVDTYILFCMDELIILAQKGTNFHFSGSEDKKSCLENSGVLNTWFESSGKKLNYIDSEKSEIYKIIANVKAEVVITSELYGDYAGKLAVIESGEDEWSVFAGAIADSTSALSDDQLSVIDGITKSMSLKENVVKEEPTYDVVIEQSLKVNDNQKPEADSETSEEADKKDTVSDPVTDEIEEDPQSTGETGKETDPETDKEQTENPADQSPVEPDASSTHKRGFNVTNQRKQEKELDKAYSSDVYSMLKLGQCGILSTVSKDGVQEPVIRLNKVYTGEEAKRKIKQYADTQSIYDYFDAPDGYTWNLVEYDVSYQNCTSTPYINIKLVGLDGNNLVFRGVPVTKRTHDASYEQKVEGDNIYRMYCYYAVANGCHEYALECGDGTVDDDILSSAYYYIHTQ